MDKPESINSLQEWKERFRLHRLSTPTFEIENNKEGKVNGINISHTQDGLRRCWKCKQMLDFSCFSKDMMRKSGLQSKCRRCSNQGVEQWRKGRPKTPRPPKVPTEKTVSRETPTYSYTPRSRGRGERHFYGEVGMYIRDRKHITTKQRAASKYEELQEKKLLEEADKLLGIKPRQKPKIR